MAKKAAQYMEAIYKRVVRITNNTDVYLGTGILLSHEGWVLTCGHLFKDLGVPDGTDLSFEIDWYIHTLDGTKHKCTFILEKFNKKETIDYAIIKTECLVEFYPPLIPRKSVEEHKAHMIGFSEDAPEHRLKIDGRIVGPVLYYGHNHPPLLQLYWHYVGSYVGFSGSPIFIIDIRSGVLLAGIQSSELTTVQVPLGTSTIAIQKTSMIFSNAFNNKSANNNDCFTPNTQGFHKNPPHILDIDKTSSKLSLPDKIIHGMQWHASSLLNQISLIKLKKNLSTCIAATTDITAIAVSVHRPNTVLLRNQLAAIFGKKRWRRNMFKALTQKELEHLRSYSEYVEIFLI
ncbi:serine protease [Plasticicumulans sp.]|uniref:S1 family peptidase n=1 Tax=Plasticicumulans sp. TaxID=2307179 RepID=UPI00321FB24D